MKHLDIGTIHAFLDGELSGDQLEFAASHFSLCEACSNLMLEAEGEADAVMQAFAVENSFAVPTQRIWARINNEIDLLDTNCAAPLPQPASIWQKAFGWFGNLSPISAPSVALGFGVVVIAFFSLFGIFRPINNVDAPPIALIENPGVNIVRLPAPETVAVNTTPTVSETPTQIKADASNKQRTRGFEVTKANYRVGGKAANLKSATPKSAKPEADLNTPLVEERLYLDAINELSETVASSEEAVMRPSFRVEYEQNVALVDAAIEKMQKKVRRSPNDENAKRILFAAYQNKLDLLNTVSEKSQLMATLR